MLQELIARLILYPGVVGSYLDQLKRIRVSDRMIRDILSTIVKSFEQFGSINMDFFKASLKDRDDIDLFMVSVAEVEVSDDEAYTRYWVGKFLSEMILDSVNTKTDKLETIREKLNLADEISLISQDRQGKRVRIWDMVEEAESRLAYTCYDKFVLKTGIDKLDEQVRMADGTVTVFLAPWKKYKSITLSNIAALGVAQKFNTLMIHFEGKKILWESRFDSCITGLQKDRLYHLLSPEEQAKFRNVWSNVKKSGVQLRFMAGIPKRTGLSDIEAELEKYAKAGIQFQLIVVDYLGLLKPSSKFGEDWQAQGDLAWDLVSLAQRGYIVATATQSTKQGAVREVLRLDDLGRSIIIAQAVDNLVAINQTEVEKMQGIIRINPMSVRDGQVTTDKITLTMSLWQMRISRDMNKYLDVLQKTG